ncbi:protein DpdF [Kitasatospora cineracea]|uniref:DNA 3'-5' helicase n=1 Tax=Kitasatospora cineracea TaxID=88074 RepID=A0A3N4REI4_9ACTN|nr:protein DpdF [Kitasatospora cineracea]RPE31818.1 helicase-like protein [Kitasatospora cineracea]
MSTQFDVVQRVLLGDPAPGRKLTGPHLRLADAWTSGVPGPAISGDIAALLAQVLRHQAGLTGECTHRLKIGLDERGIEATALERAGLTLERFGATQHSVRLGANWQPDWLRGDPRWIDLACAAPGPMVRSDGTSVPTYARSNTGVPIDPAVQRIAPGLDQYRSHSQATAVRTATLSDPASTLHVVLPTGTGKSLVGLAPGLLLGRGTTVVVVPTTALALDQERHLHHRFPDQGLPQELAYYGGRPETERTAISERLREGTQRVLFTSPEALVQSLTTPLRALAESGGLTHLVIDEAHLVRLWGLSFRPEFQLAATLVEELRAVAEEAGQRPPKIILLTATLSRSGLELNEQLFRGKADSMFVGSTYLRTEIRYLLGSTTDEETRIERLIEALHHLPRPTIVYTTKKDSARYIAARLQDAGFARTSVFDGDTGPLERLSILRRWSGHDRPTSIDVVVGTSAFGLGVDQSDVRAVVHACIPFSVDRFYQEVGRAGRDGHAALSLWLPADDDRQEGQKTESTTLIGDGKAWNRWAAMRAHRLEPDNSSESMVLDTAVVPAHNQHASESNQLWNRNTLVLMERAGLITLQRLEPPTSVREPAESEDEWRARLVGVRTANRRCLRVRLRAHVNNLDQPTWEAAVQRTRKQVRNAEEASAARIARLLNGTECWGQVLSEEYSYTDVGPMRASQTVRPVCSGCPAHGSDRPSTFRTPRAIVAEALMPDLGLRVGAGLRTMAAGGRNIIVSYPDGELRANLNALVQVCVRNGVRGIVAPQELLRLTPVRAAAQYAEEGLVAVDLLRTNGLPPSIAVPSLVLHDSTSRPTVSMLAPTSGPLRVVVVPENMHDPGYPNDLIRRIRSPHWNVNDFLRRL